MEDEFKHKLM